MALSKPSSPLSLLKYILLVGTGSIGSIVLLVTISIWRAGDRLITAIEGIFQPTPVESQIEIPTLVMERIRQANELTTAVYVMETIVPTAADRKIGEWVLATTKLVYIAQGEVRAGVDFHQLTPEDIQVDDRQITIDLPSPQILDSKIDVRRSRVYDYNRGFLNLGPDVAPQLQTLAQQKTLDKIVATACSQGILEKANQQAKEAIAQLLITTEYQQVQINTSDPLPDQCSR
jgi:hypothetical protein